MILIKFSFVVLWLLLSLKVILRSYEKISNLSKKTIFRVTKGVEQKFNLKGHCKNDLKTDLLDQ